MKPPLLAPFAPYEFTQRVTKWLPDKMRSDQESQRNGRLSPFAFAIRGDKGWQKNHRGVAPPGKLPPEQIEELSPDRVTMYRKRLYGDWLATLLPLDEEAFQLTTVDEIALDGRPSVGVEVKQDEQPTVRLYFDKETFVMTKLHYRSSDTAYLEELYDDYAEQDGLVYPRKIVSFTNGVKLYEAVTTEFKFLDDVPDSTFDMP